MNFYSIDMDVSSYDERVRSRNKSGMTRRVERSKQGDLSKPELGKEYFRVFTQPLERRKQEKKDYSSDEQVRRVRE